MLRNSIIYRRFTYIKKRNTVNIHIISKLISVTIIFLFILTYVQKLIIPQLAQVSQIKAQEAFFASVNSVSNDSYVRNSLLKSLVSYQIDKDGSLKYIQSYSLKAKKISMELSNLIDNKLEALNFKQIKVPFGTLTGVKFLSGLGPIIHIRYSSFHKVETTIVSKYSSVIGQQKSIILTVKVKTGIYIKYPFTEKSIKLDTDIPLRETIPY